MSKKIETDGLTFPSRHCSHNGRTAMNEITEELLEALKTIESWNSHTTAYAVDFGSNGVRDFYRAIARQSIAKAESALAELQADADRWIMWDGGSIPAIGNALIEVKFRDGTVDTGNSADWGICWLHRGDNDVADIVAYRIAKEPGKLTPRRSCLCKE